MKERVLTSSGALFIASCLTATAVAAAPPTHVGTEKLLFLDDHLIASQDNLTRRIHPAHKYPGNPVLWPSESWEPAYAATWGSVFRDEGLVSNVVSHSRRSQLRGERGWHLVDQTALRSRPAG